MSNEIDNKVVVMRFDNSNFENNVKTSMSTLDKLKQSLQLKDASKGFDNLNKASKKVDFSQVENTATRAGFHIQDVWLKMSQVFEYQIAGRIVNSAQRIAKALTIEPVMTGFQEYETQINAVQTILANTESKGSTIDDVNRALEELNKYADQTIYNFTEMTRNIGTFTAAGVDLDTSTNAIKGIANLAAVSGSNAQQASTAMYQLSQALASGTVKLMDWNSVVNAGMGGQVFQDALKETARVHGVAIDQMIKDEGSFRETLSKGWLTSEILTETLQKFTLTTEGLTEAEIEQNRQMLKAKGYTDDQIESIFKLGKTATDAATKVKTFSQMWDVIKESVQSGWAQTWKIIFGDFEEAKALFTPLTNFFTNIIQKFSDFRNNLLEGALSSPLGKLAEKIANVTSTTTNAVDKMKDLGDVVNRVIRGDFGNMQTRWDALTKEGYDWAKVQNLVNEKLGSSVRYTEATVEAQAESVAVIGELNDAKLKELGLTDEEIKAYRELEEQAKATGKPITELIKEMDQLDGRTMLINSFKNAGQGLVKMFAALKDAWLEIFPPMQSQQLYNIIASIHSFSEKLRMSDETADKLKRTFKGLFAIIDIITTVTGGALKVAFKVLCKLLGMANVDILSVTASVGDAIVAFRDWLDNNIFVNAVEKIVTVIGLCARKIRELVSAFMALPKVQNFIANIKTSLSNMYEVGRNAVDGLINGLRDGTIDIIGIITNIGRKILDTIKSVLGIHSPSTEMMEVGRNTMLGLVNGLKEGALKVWETIKNIGLKCIEFIRNIDFGAILTVSMIGGMFYTAKKISDAIMILKAPLDGLGEMFEGLGRMFTGIGKYFKAKAWNLIGKAVLDMALAIGILAASVYVLAQLDTKQLWGAIGALAALAAIIAVLSLTASKIEVTGDLGKLSLMLLGISASFLLIASAIKKLEFLNADNIGPVLGGFAAIIGGLSTILFVFGTFVKGKSAQNIDKAGAMILKMSLIMLSMTFVIKQVSKLDPGALAKGMVCITLFGGFVVGLIAATKLAGKHIDKAGASILKISFAILLMVGVIKAISGLDAGEIAKGITCMLLFGGIITGLIAATKLAGDNFKGIGTTMLGISSVILMMALTMKLIAGMDAGALTKGIIAIAAFGGIITGLIAATKLAGENSNKAALTLLAMSISIGILAAIAVVLGLIKLENLVKGITAVSILGGIMAAMMIASKGAEKSKGAITAMAIAIGVMAAAVAGLSFIDPSKLAGATAALSILMGMFALMAKTAGAAQSSMGALIVMTVAVGVMAGVIYLLSTLEVQPALTAVASLSLLMLSMSACLVILSGVGGLFTNALLGVVALLAMAVPLAAFVGILALMQNVQNATTNAMALTVLATALSLMLVPLSLVGILIAATGGMALLGIVALLGMVVPLLALVGVLALMQNIQNATTNTMILTTLMTAMTAMLIPLSILGPLALTGVAAIAALTGVIVAIGGLAAGIGVLMTHFPQIEDFVNNGMSVLTNLASGIGSMLGGFINGFATEAMSGLPEIGMILSQFITNAMPFITGVKLIDATAMEGVKSLAETILILTGAGILEGLTSWLTGGSSIADFGKQMAEFGPYIKQFADSVTGINPDTIQAAANAGKMLAEMASALPNSGGVVGWFMGENDMDDFGSQLKGFGTAIVDFSSAVDGKVNESAVTSAANAGKVIAELADSLPNSGGVAGWFAGNNDMSTFGSQLKGFGTAIADFSTSVEGKVNESAVTSAANAGKVLAELADSLPNSGGVASWFAGNNNMDDFGTQLKGFGTAIADFSTSVSGKTGGLSSAVSAINKLLSTLKNISGISSSAIESFKKSLSELGKTSVSGLVTAFNNSHEIVKTAVSKLINAAKPTDADKTKTKLNGQSLGNALVEGFVLGITQNTYKVRAKAKAMAKAAEEAASKELDVNSPSKVFMKTGASVVEGFAKGISDNVGDSNKAGVAMSKSLLAATQDYLKINSPSLLFKEEVGRYIVQGIAEGIKEETSAEKTAREKAEKIVNVIKDVFSEAIRDITHDIDVNNIELDIWNAGEGRNASNSKKTETELATRYANKAKYAEATNLAQSRYYDLLSHRSELGKDAESIIDGAYKEWRDAALAEQENLGAILDLEKKTTDDIISLNESKIGTLNSDIAYRNSLDSDEISESFRDKQNWEDLNKILGYTKEQVEIAESKWNEICQKGLENTEEGIAARQELTKALQAEEDAEDAVWDQVMSISDRTKRRAEDVISRSGTALNLWEELYGDKATDEERDAKYLEHYNTTWVEKTKIAQQAKEDYLDAIEEYGKKSEEATKYWDIWQKALVDEAEAKNAVTDYIKEAQERENEQLRELYDLTQSNADLQYQIWEKTAGRDSTNAEKDAKKLEILSEQLTAQTGSVLLATKLYNEAVEEYGEGSNEALSAYNNYLNESLELANLNSEILDIEEKNAKRQEKARNAKSDYLEYMKKYEKYYLDHGMTLEELEKDARLVSGYDPNYKETANKTVSSIVNETNNAINDLTSSTDYQKLITNFSDIGTTFAEAVSTGATGQTATVISTVTTMITKCLNALKEKCQSWFTAGVEAVASFDEGFRSMYETTVTNLASMVAGWVSRVNMTTPWWIAAGVNMVDGFIEGIESRIEAAARAAARMAAAALMAAKSEFDINSPSREFAKLGAYAVMGLVNGFDNNADLAADAAGRMVDATIDNLKNTIAAISDIINSDIDSEPTIRPVLDLSNVEAGTTRLNAMFSRTQAVRISNGMNRQNGEEIQNGSGVNGVNGGNTTYQFTQNNYSPKALSRAEIYRQTKNQFSVMKRTVKA